MNDKDFYKTYNRIGEKARTSLRAFKAIEEEKKERAFNEIAKELSSIVQVENREERIEKILDVMVDYL